MIRLSKRSAARTNGASRRRPYGEAHDRMRLEVLVESGAGGRGTLPMKLYRAAGATIVPDPAAALSQADIVLKVQALRSDADGGAGVM